MQQNIWAIIVILLLWLIEFFYLYRNFPSKQISSIWINIDLINKHVLEKKLPRYRAVFLYNQTYIFPMILTFYLIILLIQQTKLFDLQLTWLFLTLNQNFVLYCVIVSGIGTVFVEDISDYQTIISSKESTRWYISLSCGLSLLGAYIILWQVNELGIIGIIIWWIAWLLIFLVWMMLMDEDENENL